jgi:hypothetical protein
LFFVKDHKEKGNIEIQYCPTNQMIGDFMTKPLHGKKFEKFRQAIMNLPCTTQLMMAACVEGDKEIDARVFFTAMVSLKEEKERKSYECFCQLSFHSRESKEKFKNCKQLVVLFC